MDATFRNLLSANEIQQMERILQILNVSDRKNYPFHGEPQSLGTPTFEGEEGRKFWRLSLSQQSKKSERDDWLFPLLHEIEILYFFENLRHLSTSSWLYPGFPPCIHPPNDIVLSSDAVPNQQRQILPQRIKLLLVRL
jgi:hypothetical protein